MAEFDQTDFQDILEDPGKLPDSEIIKEIEADNEKEYLSGIKKKNKNFLVQGLSVLEKERIAQHIISKYEEALPKHNELCDKIDEWDEVYRMQRFEVPGSDGDMPNYRSPMTTTALEVTHANIMNVFFSPKDLMRVLPTEEGDIPKVKKLSVFGNWSMRNEMEIFDNVDRLFHYSGKTGEAPYMVTWEKEYGIEIKRKIVPDPTDPTRPLFDPDTKEPIFQEVEEPKLLYNGPKFESFSRKDYIQPPNALVDQKPEYEFRIIRKSYDKYLRAMEEGRMYNDTITDIMTWAGDDQRDIEKEDSDGDDISLGKWNEEFLLFFGTMRIKVIKDDLDDEEAVEEKELEDEFIAIVHRESQTLCQLRHQKFPLKMRPIGVDYFMIDDEGRRKGYGMVEMLEGPQKSYDALFNQFIHGTVQSNNPFGFFTPISNQRNEPIKIKNGYLFPTADPSGVNIVKMPPPDDSLQVVLELIRNWAQVLFGISDFAAGVESKIDPDAPAKKAQIVVAQGNVRLNMIIKRKNKTLQDIFKRWYLLYRDNMPPNKFMRIAGDDKNNPWRFEGVSLADFALKSLPDFELIGNILNANKSFEANKAIAIYNVLIRNPFFNPATAPGLRALHSMTKWLIEKFDETGLSRFLPEAAGEQVATPEEENARFLQGDDGEPVKNEDHINHIRVHTNFMNDPNVPEEIKGRVFQHIQKHIQMIRDITTEQSVFSQAGVDPTQFNQGSNRIQPGGGGNGQPGGTQNIASGSPEGIFSSEAGAGMGRFQG